MLIQILGLVGAALVLAAYALLSTHRLRSTSTPYQLLNLVGAVILTYVAFVGRQAGFTVLNAVWALIALKALVWPGRGASREPARHE